jgi:hypothetical protein
MKNPLKLFYPMVIVFATLPLFTLAQTNVSGGIYTNTTWTLANSPYIVTDTVVVFPGVILTIQPGVAVKFNDNMLLEIRQASLIAEGTSADSITFTSNSNTPTVGIWEGIFLNGGTFAPVFSYCNFLYADYAINTNNINFNFTLTVKNSKIMSNNVGFECPYLYINIDSCYFRNNNQCLYGDGNVANCRVTNNQMGIAQPGNSSSVNNCLIDSNQTGIHGTNGPIINCTVINNQTGIHCVHYSKMDNCIIRNNQTGVSIQGSWDTLRNSIIDSNSVAGIEVIGEYACVEYCQIKYNGIGIAIANPATTRKNYIESNFIGIRLGVDGDKIFCNKICNNTSYDLVYTSANNTTVHNNYWCVSDSATITSQIYDGYDDISLGLISFLPFDTLQCYLNSTGNCSANFNLYPDSITPHLYYAVNMASGVQPLTYLWNWGDGTSDTIAYPSHTYSVAGYYNICHTITDYTSCTSTYCDSSYLSKNSDAMVTVNVIPNTITGISANFSDYKLSIFPNPANDFINMQTPQPSEIEILNLQGQVMKQINSDEELTIIDVSGFPAGLYFVKAKTQKYSTVGKFIKE